MQAHDAAPAPRAARLTTARRPSHNRRVRRPPMSDWIHNLPVPWLSLLVFAVTFLVTGLIYVAVMALATGERARTFKAMSPGMLPPLGILFGLLIAFVASQVWGDFDR